MTGMGESILGVAVGTGAGRLDLEKKPGFRRTCGDVQQTAPHVVCDTAGFLLHHAER